MGDTSGWGSAGGGQGGSCLCPQVFSQHPYAEKFIGKPHVWTVDYNDSAEFEAALQAILSTQVGPVVAPGHPRGLAGWDN